MSLTLSRRLDSGHWQITGTVAGRRVRQSTGTPDRRIAEEIRAQLEAELYRGAIYGPRAVITWDQACISYLDSEPRSAADQARLLRLTDHLAGRRLQEIDQALLDRVIQGRCKPTAQPATKLREVITPIRAVLTHAARRRWCDMPAFEVPKGATGVTRTAWLRPAEVQRLAAAAGSHLRPLVLFLAGCGARMGEALALDWKDVDLTHGRALLRVTKNGRDRVAELPPATAAALANLPHRGGRVFRPPVRTVQGKPFQPEAYAETDGVYGGQVASAWAGACRRAGLMEDSGKLDADGNAVLVPCCTPHTLRHSWATWHYAVHRDLVRLRIEGGWNTTSQTERYTKLAPATLAAEILQFWGLAVPVVVGKRRRA